MRAKSWPALLCLFGLVGCYQPGSNSSGLSASNTQFQAICEITSGSNLVVCLDFPSNTTSYYNSCTSTEQSNYTSQSANGSNYVGVNVSPGSTSCNSTYPSLSLVGSCVLSDRIIRYYSNTWSTGTAQSNCLARSGTWSIQ